MKAKRTGFAVLAAGLLVAFGGGGSARADQPKDPFNGKVFDVRMVDEGGGIQDDQLIFQDGLFDSSQCRQYGFTKVAYKVRTNAEKGVTTFEATATSATDGNNNWTGELRGGDIEGRLVWTNKKGKVQHYTFTGKSQR